jgi:hypothetical protein
MFVDSLAAAVGQQHSRVQAWHTGSQLHRLLLLLLLLGCCVPAAAWLQLLARLDSTWKSFEQLQAKHARR